MDDKTVRARVLRDFNDVGTEHAFTKDAEVDLTPGELANYQACGLVEAIVAEGTTPTANEPEKPVDPVAPVEPDGETKKAGRRG